MKSFVQALRARDAAAARALEFLILTNVRTDTALRAEWRELDLVGAVWSIPPAKLKDRIHRKDPFRVPLAPRVIEIIQEMRQLRTSDYVFPGQSSGRPLSNMAMATVIRRMNNVAPHEERWIDPDQDRLIVPHGFRATFRVWAEEAGNFRNAIIEEAMGHSVGSAVERAYRRTDVLELRRELMDAWSMFCAP